MLAESARRSCRRVYLWSPNPASLKDSSPEARSTTRAAPKALWRKHSWAGDVNGNSSQPGAAPRRPRTRPGELRTLRGLAWFHQEILESWSFVGLQKRFAGPSKALAASPQKACSMGMFGASGVASRGPCIQLLRDGGWSLQAWHALCVEPQTLVRAAAGKCTEGANIMVPYSQHRCNVI